VAESLIPGVTIADVARRHGTTRWQVYDWRRRARDGRLVLSAETSPSVAFASVVVAEAQPESGAHGSGIEVVVGDVILAAGAPGAGAVPAARRMTAKGRLRDRFGLAATESL
jgi:transposase